MEEKNYKAIIEAILFTMGESVELEKIADAIELDKKTTKKLINEMMQEWNDEGRGVAIMELDGAYQMCTRTEMYEYLIRIAKQPKRRVLTDVLLETLSIIAYKQPVTRGEIESVRGIRCERVIEGLQKKGLIQEVGRSAAIGRPILYGTTDVFLQHFDLESIQDLPEIEDIEAVIQLEGDADQPAFQQISIDLEQK